MKHALVHQHFLSPTAASHDILPVPAASIFSRQRVFLFYTPINPANRLRLGLDYQDDVGLLMKSLSESRKKIYIKIKNLNKKIKNKIDWKIKITKFTRR